MVERQVDCKEFRLTLKQPSSSQSLAEFNYFGHLAFSSYTDILCSVFPYRSHKLNVYMAIIAKLALYYGETLLHIHKLANAPSEWLSGASAAFWGAVDTDLHNQVFLS